MVEFISSESRAKSSAYASFAEGVKLAEHIKMSGNRNSEGTPILEFVGTGDFPAAHFIRQRYEVFAGREEEPEIWRDIYTDIPMPDAPKNVSVLEMGPGGVVVDEVLEGGEVKFASVLSSNFTIPMKRYAFGLEYSEDVLIYNQVNFMPLIERAAGRAFSAKMNAIHIDPIINFVYPATNSVAASADGTGVIEKTIRTLEDAIVEAETDTANPRYGPYVLLVGSGSRFRIERALSRVPQQNFENQSGAIDMISKVIVYKGWTGKRGAKVTTYAGVPANTAFLISLANRDSDFQSILKSDLHTDEGNADVSRFIKDQTVWSLIRGVYANPLRAVQKIALPAS